MLFHSHALFAALVAALLASQAPTPQKPARGPKKPEASIAEQLQLPSNDLALRHAMAVYALRSGDVDGAIAQLETALAAAGEAPEKAALETELARARAWKTAREAWLGELATSGGKFQIERDGKKLNVRVVRDAEGTFALEIAKAGDAPPLASIDLATIAAAMKGTPAGAPEWARPYAYLVSGDARWEKILQRDKSAEAQALRADAARYPELLRLGVAGSLIESLTKETEPADLKAAESVRQRLQTIMKEASGAELVKQRSPALRRLGERAFGKIYDETKPAPTFAGKSTWIDANTVELEYSFDSPAEGNDWVEEPEYLSYWRGGLSKITAPAETHGSKIEAGEWRVLGSFVYRHVLTLDAPIDVVFTSHSGEAYDPSVQPGTFFVAVVDDGDGAYVGMTDTGQLHIHDPKLGTHSTTRVTEGAKQVYGQPRTWELHHDGAKAKLSHDGIADAEHKVIKRKSGGVVLAFHTSRTIALESFKVRGKVGAEGRAKLREIWVNTRLRELGL
jgi:hypothetical protein